MPMEAPLDLYQLRALHAFARAGSFAGAAQRLCVTQSAISHAIRKLEGSAGVALVDRRGPKVQLTEEGRHLCRACEAIFTILETVTEDLRRDRSRVSGRIRLGTTVEFGCSILIKHLQPFLEAHPGVHLDITFSANLLGPLLRDDLDMAIDCRNLAHPELLQTPLFRECYVLVGSPRYLETHPLTQPSDLDLCTLLSYDKDGTWWHRFLCAIPEAHRPRPKTFMAMDHVRAMVHGAVHGLGIALVPQYCVLSELERQELTLLFPEIRPSEDHFCIYQKRATADREKQRLLTGYLQGITPEEFGSGDVLASLPGA